MRLTSTQLSDWRDILRPRLEAGLFERGRTILGEPGLGKSSLVRRIANEAARRGDWVTPQIRIAVGSDPIKRLAGELLVIADTAGMSTGREARVTRLLQRVESIAINGVSFALSPSEGQEPHSALTDRLVEIGLVAIGRGITRDEVVRGWREAQAEATSHVERILDRLPPREREFLEAMADLNPRERTLTRIAKEAGFAKSTDAGPPSQRLDRVRGIISRGKPYSFRHRALEAFLTGERPNVD